MYEVRKLLTLISTTKFCECSLIIKTIIVNHNNDAGLANNQTKNEQTLQAFKF